MIRSRSLKLVPFDDEADAVSDTTFDVGGLFVTTAFSELHESAEVVLTSAT